MIIYEIIKWTLLGCLCYAMLSYASKRKKERKKEREDRTVSAKRSRQSDLTLDASVPPKTFPQPKIMQFLKLQISSSPF